MGEGISAGSATAYLYLDKSNYTKGISDAKSEMGNFEKATSSSSSGLKNFGGALVGVGAKITAGVTTPIIGAGVAMAKTVGDFDSKMSNVQALLGSSTTDTKKLREEAIKLGADTSFSASQAADGMANLASAGFNTNQVIEAMPGMLNLAASSQTDLATASEITASAVNGFGLAAKDASKVADIFAQAAAESNAGVVDTGEAMKYVAPVANSFGLKITETTAAIEEMANAGIKGSEAGTSLRGSLTSLAKPSDQAAKAMQQTGFSAFDAHGKMKALPQLIGDLQKSMKGMTQEQQQNYLVTLFGQQSLSGMNVLLKDGQGQLEKTTKGLENCKGAADKMAKVQLDNIKGDFEQLSGSVETLAINSGEILVPQVRKLIQSATELVNKFNSADNATKQLILKGAAFAAAFGPALVVFGKIQQGAGSVISSVSKMGDGIAKFAGNGIKDFAGAGKSISSFMGDVSKLDGIKTLSGGLDTLALKAMMAGDMVKTKLAPIGTAFTSVTGKITSEIGTKLPQGLTQGFTKMRTSVAGELPKLTGLFGKMGSGVLSGIQGLLGAAMKVIAPAAIIATLLVGLGVAYQQFGPEIDKYINLIVTKGPAMITSFANSLLTKIPDLIATGTTLLMRLIYAITANLPAIIAAAANIISALVNGLANNIPRLIPVVINLIGTLVTAIVQNLPTIIKAGLNLLVALAQGFANNVDKMVKQIVDLIILIVKVVAQNLPTIIKAGIQILVALITGLAKALPQLIAAIPTIIKAIWDGITSVNWLELGWDIIKGIGEGIKQAAIGLLDSVKKLAQDALDAVKGLLGIHSPSKVFADQVGKFIPAGIAEGINAAHNLVNGALSSMVSDIAIQPTINSIDNKITKAVDDTPSNPNTKQPKSGSGDTFNFYSNRSIDEVEAARLMKKTKREVAEGL